MSASSSSAVFQRFQTWRRFFLGGTKAFQCRLVLHTRVSRFGLEILVWNCNNSIEDLLGRRWYLAGYYGSDRHIQNIWGQRPLAVKPHKFSSRWLTVIASGSQTQTRFLCNQTNSNATEECIHNGASSLMSLPFHETRHATSILSLTQCVVPPIAVIDISMFIWLLCICNY